MSRSWIEIKASALEANFRTFQKLSKAKVTPVLKGNAYGHGLKECFTCLAPLLEAVCVFHLEEGLALRALEKSLGISASPRRIFVLGAIAPEELSQCLEQDLEVVVPGVSFLKDLKKFNFQPSEKVLKLHLHIDTGLSREGLLPEELTEQNLGFLNQHPQLKLVAVLSHFANTEDVTEQQYAKKQLKTFHEGVEKIQKIFPNLFFEKHFAASAPTLVLPEAHFDRIRVGISLYGLWPSTESRISTQLLRGHLPSLVPVLSWKCQSQAVRWIPSDTFVGYGCTFKSQRPTRIAIFPVGYSDGYPRTLSHKAHVLVEGKRCPVLGRVMMNYLTVDVTEVPEKASYESVLIGSQQSENLSAETLAEWGNTLHYEIITRIHPELPRHLV